MKRMIMALCSLLLITTLQINAQPQEERNSKKKADKTALLDLQDRYQKWTKEMIFPRLIEWKADLDKTMNSEDLATLNRLRTEVKGLRDKRREHIQGLHKAWRSEDEKALKEHRTGLTGVHKKWLDIINELEPLAFRYREALKELIQTSRPFIKEWKKEGKEILTQWKEEHEELTHRNLRRHIQKHYLLGKWFSSHLSKRKKVARLMLWDGEVTTKDINDDTIPSQTPNLN